MVPFVREEENLTLLGFLAGLRIRMAGDRLTGENQILICMYRNPTFLRESEHHMLERFKDRKVI